VTRQRVAAVCISRPAIQGNASKKKTTGRLPRPLPAVSSFVQLRQRGLATTNPGRSQHALFRASCVTRCAVAARPFANEQYAFRLRAVWQRVVAVCLSILFSRGLHTLTRKLHKRQIATLFCRGLRRPTFTLFGKTARKKKMQIAPLFCLVTRFAGVLKSERKVLKNKSSTDNRYPLVELKILTKQAANLSGGLSYYRNQRLQTKIVGVYW